MVYWPYWPLSITAFATDYSSWAFYRNVTVNTSGLSLTGNVTGIPLLIRLTAAADSDMLNNAPTQILANGADIRITKSDGTTDLPFEIVSATTGATGAAEIWVLADTVLQNSATAYSLRVYWGKTGATSVSNPPAVFSPSNGFLAVWHFTTLNDATGHGYTLSATAAPTDASAGNAIIGNSKTFDGSTQFFNISDSNNATPTGATLSLNSNNGPYTVTAWAKPVSCPSARMGVIGKYDGAGSAGTRQWALQTKSTVTNWGFTDDPNIAAFTSATAGNEYVADAVGACAANTLVYMAGSYSLTGTPVVNTTDNTGAGNLKFSVNGGAPVTSAVGAVATGSQIGTNALPFIGKLSGTAPRYMNGTLDEITVSNVQRSADWIALSYATQKPAATALTVGSTVGGVTGPAITTGPASQSTTTGSQVLFTVVATGTPPLTYKWVHLHGSSADTTTHAASSSLTDTLKIAAAALADTGSYKVLVSNSANTAVSGTATLTVTAGPAIASQPASATVNAGGSVKFGVVVSGTTPFIYKWMHVHGVTTDTLKRDTLTALTDTLSLATVAITDTGFYKVTVSNSAGPATSAAATLTVIVAPGITTQPANQSATVGTPAKFFVTATGSFPLIYKWLHIHGATTDTLKRDTLSVSSDTLKLASVAMTDTGSYKVVIVNAANSAVSNPATLTVTPVGIIWGSAAGSAFSMRVTGSSVSFRFPEGISDARVTVMNIRGQAVWSQRAVSGMRELSWDGKSSGGRPVSGLYIVRLTAQDAQHKPMVAESKILLTP